MASEAFLALAEAQDAAIAMIGLRGEAAKTAARRALRERQERRFDWVVRRAWRRAFQPVTEAERAREVTL